MVIASGEQKKERKLKSAINFPSTHPNLLSDLLPSAPCTNDGQRHKAPGLGGHNMIHGLLGETPVWMGTHTRTLTY